MGSVTIPRAEDSIDMARIVFGDDSSISTA